MGGGEGLIPPAREGSPGKLETPVSFMGRAHGGGGTRRGEENLLYGFDRNSHHGIIMEARSLCVMKTICRVKTHMHKY